MAAVLALRTAAAAGAATRVAKTVPGGLRSPEIVPEVARPYPFCALAATGRASGGKNKWEGKSIASRRGIVKGVAEEN